MRVSRTNLVMNFVIHLGYWLGVKSAGNNWKAVKKIIDYFCGYCWDRCAWRRRQLYLGTIRSLVTAADNIGQPA
jgi:hypothetical protein